MKQDETKVTISKEHY